MASYNELNALIDAYINRNGVQAITGQILNGVLKAMVEQLGRGYTIMGAATPATDPGTPDGPECYFASTPGTYTDFDGLQVAPGELALLCYTPSDGWTKATIYEGFRQVGATIDGNVGTPSVGVTYANGVLSFDFHNMKGNPGQNGQDGAAAGFGTIGADITGGVGTPGVSVESSGPATAKNLQFHFTNLKGETGVTSVVATVDNTTGTPACTVSLEGQQLTLAFSGLKGAQGDTGSSVDYPFTIVNNLTTDDATQALSAAQGVVLDGKVTQLEAKVTDLEKDVVRPTFTLNSGYVKEDGTIGANADYSYTSPIPLTKGQTIVVKTEGYLFAPISKYDNPLVPVVFVPTNPGSGVQVTYSYTAPDNISVVCSARTDHPYEISQNGKISDLDHKVDAEAEKLQDEIDDLVSIVEGAQFEAEVTKNVTAGSYSMETFDCIIPVGKYQVDFISNGCIATGSSVYIIMTLFDVDDGSEQYRFYMSDPSMEIDVVKEIKQVRFGYLNNSGASVVASGNISFKFSSDTTADSVITRLSVVEDETALKNIIDPDSVVNIDLDEYNAIQGSLPSSGTSWYYSESTDGGYHKGIPLNGKKIVGFTANIGCLIGWMDGRYTDSISFIPYLEGTGRIVCDAGENVLDVPAEAEYIVLCVADGAGTRVSFTDVALYDNEQYPLKQLEEKANKINEMDTRLEKLEMETPISVYPFRLAFWNIGHFSIGTDSRSTITDNDYQSKKALYLNLLRSISAQVICFAEYNEIFNTSVPGSTPEEEILSDYPYSAVGEHLGYNMNAVFSMMKIANHSIYTYTHQGGQTRYATEAVVELFPIKENNSITGNSSVKIVATHLELDTTIQRQQIDELIARYSTEDRVIICGDFNLYNEGDFDQFSNAGFTLVDRGIINEKTYPTGYSENGEFVTPQILIDNIIVKGFDVTKARVYQNAFLSDHCLICADLKPIYQ